MAELSLYLIHADVTVGQSMEAEKGSSGGTVSVELSSGLKKTKVPRRTIYFASGETMEEFSTEEEEEEEEEEQEKQAAVSTIDPSTLAWGPYFWFYMWRMATSTISVCDYLGEKMASALGITSPKYQYAIDEYYRMKKEEEEVEEEDRLAEEAERRFEEQQQQGDAPDPARDPAPNPAQEQPEGTSSFVNMSFQMEPEPRRS